MRNKFILATIFLSSLLSFTWVYAHYEHYSITNQLDTPRREDVPAPCNYVTVSARFKREQKVFEKRVRNICENITCNAQGSGCGLIFSHCYYLKYHPRFLKLKQMLGEPHPVRKK